VASQKYVSPSAYAQIISNHLVFLFISTKLGRIQITGLLQITLTIGLNDITFSTVFYLNLFQIILL
jgi:hypothetical protein